jgi:hypothetical protein
LCFARANAGECTLDEFVTLDKYSHAAATMTYESFKVWWGRLMAAVGTQLPVPDD